MSSTERTRASRKPPGERAAEIAEAARSIALTHGLAAVTLRAVATRAGVTPALVAHYAAGMEMLVAEAFAAIVQAELEEIRGFALGGSTPSAQLARLVSAALDPLRQDVTVVWVEAWSLGRRNEALAVRVRTQMDAWQQTVRRIVAAGAETGEFVTEDPAGVAWQLLGMIDGLNAQALVRWGTATERGPLIAHAVEGMLGLPRGSLTAEPIPAPPMDSP
ncbi:MAG TPA: TetR/AcrR family transcriptional regulator [Humibacter sp.]|nr:TetR/AcrR family transcriptional regulator [Humibacter sp.]